MEMEKQKDSFRKEDFVNDQPVSLICVPGKIME